MERKIDAVLSRLCDFFDIKTDNDLADRMGEKRSTFGSWRARGSIPYAKLIDYANEHDINIYWLLDGEHPKRKSELGYDPNFTSVPRYDVKVSAGNGYQIHSEQLVDSLKFKTDWLISKGANITSSVLIEVIGDSMEPKLYEGDLVLVDTSQTEIMDGKAFVIRIDNDLLVKYIQRLPGGKYQLFSENTIYHPITLTYDELEKDVNVIGRVLSSTHDW
ncbi:MAG: helix-turn-helix domain-containing protein [Kangiella sp.]|nr:helix-turn-helix domain-containing protein [Kangiella sp.]MCW9029223.1 helix-turn-helix domain-containing protein [Kangiella sp.]